MATPADQRPDNRGEQYPGDVETRAEEAKRDLRNAFKELATSVPQLTRVDRFVPPEVQVARIEAAVRLLTDCTAIDSLYEATVQFLIREFDSNKKE